MQLGHGRPGPELWRVAGHRQGQETADDTGGQSGAGCRARLPRKRASRDLEGPSQPVSFRNGAGWADDPPGVLETAARPWTEGRRFSSFDAARDPAHLRHAPAGGWRRLAQRADHAGACGYLDHPDLHARHAVAAAEDSRRAPSQGLIGTAMSDYMFMLESHLSADQNRVLEQVQAAAGAAGVNLFLTGGGMRDMLGGF